MKKVFLSNKIQINALKHLIMLSFISNLIEGFAFSQLLQIPYLDFFSKLFVGSNQILVVAQLLFFYRFGRLMISLSDSRLPSFVHNNGLKLALSILGLGLLLISISQTYTIHLFIPAAVLIGMGTTLSSINLREILTFDSDVLKKRKFNIFSSLGWSIGVGISGFILQERVFIFESILAISFIIIGYLIAIYREDKTQVQTENSFNQKSKIEEIQKLSVSNKNILILFSMSALMAGLISNQINTSVMSKVIGTFHFREGLQSLVLLLPILGSLLSLVPLINNFFKRSFTFLGITALNIIYFLILIQMTLTESKIFYLILLSLVGLFSNEILTAIYQNVATKQKPEYRRATHALIESLTVCGSLLTWFLNKQVSQNLIINFALIIIVPSLLLIFLTDFKLFIKESSEND